MINTLLFFLSSYFNWVLLYSSLLSLLALKVIIYKITGEVYSGVSKNSNLAIVY